MQRLRTIFWTALCALHAVCHAQPIVIGFERFHGAHSTPDERGGRLLYNELGCANCHGGATGLPSRLGPELGDVARRLNAEWIRTFLDAPEAAHPGSTMPAMFGGRPAADREAVLQYLTSLAPKTVSKAREFRHVNARRGRELFHMTGCVACHEPDAAFSIEDGAPQPADFTHPPITLPDLRSKTTLAPLAAFLLEPSKIRPDGRMPKLLFTEDDAVDVAGYLLGFEGSDGKLAAPLTPAVPDPALIQRGKILVEEMQCAACHSIKGHTAPAPRPVRATESGCLGAPVSANSPRYNLTAAQRSGLQRYLRTSPTTTEKVSGGELDVNLTLQALNCAACHERNGEGGPDAARRAYFLGDHNLGDTGRFPPPLTGVGRKLRPEWLSKVLEGGNHVRPYLKTRMPVFGKSVENLAKGLEQEDSREGVRLPGGDDEAGRRLLGTSGGMGCITCHGWGAKASLGIQALDLSNIGQRLQPEWLHDYLVDPSAYRPGTLMPSFWPHGVSSNPQILGGDTLRQIASIYSFAKSANGEPEGFPETGGGEFEMLPRERPLVQRTFMEDAGTHAILVGFPEGVHLAFNGLSAQPALAWKGRFFDAYNTWFSRFAPFEMPLGDSIVKWAPTPVREEDRFDGYRLDAAGVPTFLSTVSGAAVEDRYIPVEGGLRRLFRWRSGAGFSPNPRHPDGVEVREVPSADLKDGWNSLQFNYLWK